MATTLTNIASSKPVSSLDTYIHTTTQTGPYFVSCRLSAEADTSIIITIQHNGSNVLASPATTSHQHRVNLSSVVGCTAGDTVSVVLSSSNNADSLPNAFQGTILITPFVS